MSIPYKARVRWRRKLGFAKGWMDGWKSALGKRTIWTSAGVSLQGIGVRVVQRGSERRPKKEKFVFRKEVLLTREHSSLGLFLFSSSMCFCFIDPVMKL